MTEPVRIEEELAQLDFEPRCEITPNGGPRCAQDATVLVDIHGHNVQVGMAAPWRRMLMCERCLRSLDELLAGMNPAAQSCVTCRSCGEIFREPSDFLPMVKPL